MKQQNKLYVYIMLLIVIFICGCATKQMSLEEMESALARNEEASVRFYPEKSINEVRKAAQRVLYLLDPSDMRFEMSNNELLATRSFSMYAIFVVQFGREWHSFNFEQTPNGTTVKYSTCGEINAGMIVPPIPYSFKHNIPISAHQNSEYLTLIHDRIEYVLGIRDEWAMFSGKLGIGIEDRPPDWEAK